jgi:hypothetical protein
MKKRLSLLLAVLFLASTMAAAQAQAQSQTTTFPVTNVQFNTCNGDLVILNGKETVRSNIQVNNGIFYVHLSDRIRGEGVSATGARYTYDNSSRDQYSTSEGVTRTVQKTRLVLNKVDGPGPDDLVVLARSTFLVNNQTGQVARESQEFQARCR